MTAKRQNNLKFCHNRVGVWLFKFFKQQNRNKNEAGREGKSNSINYFRQQRNVRFDINADFNRNTKCVW